MPLPIKKYFYINEVSNRWHRNVKDVKYCIENGLKRSITVKSKMLLIVSKIKIPLIALLIYLIFTYLDRLS